MKTIRLLLVIFSAMGFGQGNAYELATHGKLTFEAYNRSILAQDPKVAKDLGLDINSADPFSAQKFGARYIDATGNFSFLRVVDPFERQRMPKELRQLSLSVSGWLMRGAIREDDVRPLFGDNPQDDPYGNINRVCGHFFDPFNNRGLNSTVAGVLCGTGVQPKASDWALGTFDAFAQPSVPNPGRRNHFTVLDARLAMYNALTGKGANPDPRTETSRNAWWATTFRALGDVVHLLQDMAQPQHTRNEAHPSLFETGYYEKYIEGRASGEESVRINGEEVPTKPLNFGNYPKPIFTRFSDFFATNPGGNGVLDGKGLAEYSNRGFFTDDHNFGSGAAREFPAPSSNRVDYEEETATFPDLLQHGVQVKFLRGVVPDTQIGGASPIRMTTESAFSRFRVQKLYGLNRYNFDDQADILLPRAVAYSAGLLDYFFRGKIDCKPEPTLPGTCRIQNLGTELMKGTFEFFYDDADGYRRPVPNARWDGISLNPNDGLVVAFNPPTAPEAKNAGEYMLVFTGDLGEEKAVGGSLGAVAAKLIKGPLKGFLVTPNFVAGDGVTGARHIYKNGNTWTLNPVSGIVAGNIDWKGWYENGKPTRVLTWKGPRNRSLMEPGFRSPFGAEIYQDGETFASASNSVLGAALTKDAAGKEWIIAIVADQFMDVAYRRPNQKSTSSALFNSTSAPDGWQEIGRNDRQLFSPERAWFFNGAGTEAQTIKIPASGLGRIRVSATNTEAAVFSNIPFVGVPYEKSSPRIITDFEGPSINSGCMNGSNTFDIFQTRHNDVEIETGGTAPAFAVDYIDDKLVLASSESVNYGSSHETETVHYVGTALWPTNRPGYESCVGGATQITYSTNIHYLKQIGTNGYKTRLKLGDTSIDIPVEERVDTLEASSPDDTSVPGGFQTYSDFNSNKFSIAYLDLRDGFYALYRNQKKGRSNAVLTSKERVDLSDGQSIALGDGDPNRFIAGGQFTLTNDAYSIGYGRDLSGQFVFSMRFIKQAEPFSSVPIYYNFLSNGSLPSLINPAPASALYAPIGVLR